MRQEDLSQLLDFFSKMKLFSNTVKGPRGTRVKLAPPVDFDSPEVESAIAELNQRIPRLASAPLMGSFPSTDPRFKLQQDFLSAIAANVEFQRKLSPGERFLRSFGFF